MLLMRLGIRIHAKGAFFVCSLLLAAALAFPRVGVGGPLWINGLYDSLTIILIFPLIVAIGAGDRGTGGVSLKLCKFLGDLSYPLYITHYPLIYIYTSWVVRNKVHGWRGVPFAVFLFVAAIALAYAC